MQIVYKLASKWHTVSLSDIFEKPASKIKDYTDVHSRFYWVVMWLNVVQSGLIWTQYGSGGAAAWQPEDSQSDPGLPQNWCWSVLEWDSEPLIAPDVQVVPCVVSSAIGVSASRL